MQPHKRTQAYLRRLALCAAMMTASLALAQTPPSEDSKADPAKKPAPAAAEKPSANQKEQKLPTKEEVAAAGKASGDASLAEDGETLVLSPFEVTTEKDKGYRGGQTMSGTRMGADLDDIANPITVVTKQQLLDFAARDINDIFASELSVEGTRTFTANSFDGKQDVDSVALNPETANRVRGLGAANISVGNFGRSSTVPIDVYNVDAVEISRGPNSSIFGMGEASGTVNLVPSSANISRDFSKVSMSYSSYGTKRATTDLNRMLWKNTLALRVIALAENKEFLRKPSYDNTRRITIGTTYHPFQSTTFRVSVERFKEKYDRPNSVMPRDMVSLWNQTGRPSWDPTTNTWSTGAFTDPYTGISYAPNTGYVLPPSNAGAAYGFPYPTVTWLNGVWQNPTNTSSPAVWLNGYGSNRVRPVMFVDQGQVQWAGNMSWSGPTTAPSLVRRELMQFALPVGYNVPGPYQTNAVWNPKGAIGYTQLAATKDKSFYDYESINLAGLNYGNKKADTWNLELEQYIINTPMNVLAFQVGMFKERIEDYRRTFVGNGGDGVSLYIQPDVNLKLPDGTPNPYYGAPFIYALAPQTYVNPIDSLSRRANVVYQLDLRKETSFLKYLGMVKVLGYAEDSRKTQAPKNLRYQDQIVSSYDPWLTPNIRNNNSAKFNSRYYLGDGVGGNVDYGSVAPPTNNLISFQRFSSLAGEPTPINTNTWYTLNNVPVAPVWFANTLQNTQTTTRGMILQDYLWKDKIITTWGRRRDTLRTRDTVDQDLSSTSFVDPVAGRDANGLITSTKWMENYADWNVTNLITQQRLSTGYTDNKGIVVKPTKWLRLRYNQSTSFKPEAFGINFQGDPLPNSGGKSKDYGFELVLFNGKVNINLTRYDTKAIDSRDDGINTVAARITNMDFDLSPSTNSVQYDLEDWYQTELLHSRGLIHSGETGLPATMVVATTAQEDQALADTHTAIGLTDLRIDRNRAYTRAMTVDRRSRGYELSIDYNPNPYLTIKFNGQKQETIYTRYGSTWQDYKNERMPIWTTITSPYNGARFWDQILFGGSAGKTAQQNWLEQDEAPMKVNLALEGKPVPQYAKYKFNILGSARLAWLFKNTPVLKDITVGGKFSWTARAGLGFYGAAPESDGYVRDYDPNRPVWDHAHMWADAFARYDFRLYKNRVKSNIQLNAKNVGQSGYLQPFGVNPDGTKFNYRIIDPTEYILSVNFEL